MGCDRGYSGRPEREAVPRKVRRPQRPLCSCCSPPNQGSVTANATASCAAASHVQYCRWHNILKPGIIKRPWTDAEDNTIFTMIAKMGKKWTVIAAELPGR